MKRLVLLAPVAWTIACAPAPAVAPEAPAAGPAAAAPPSIAAPARDAAAPPPPAAAATAAASRVDRAVATDAPVLSNITQADILAAVNKNGEAFNACYAIGAGASKTYRAKITVKATVGPTGAVNSVEIVSSTARNAKVDGCVADAFKTLTFNRAVGSGATVFTFPLTFDGGQAP